MTARARSGRLAFAMQIVLALEVAVLGGVLGAFWYNGVISGQTWLLIAAGWYFGVRALAVAKNFLQTEISRSPREPQHELGLAGTLRLLWGEYYSTLVVYSFLFPFEAWLVPQVPAPAADAGAGTPIVLVPGFCCNRGYWALFVRWFKQAGHGPVYAVTLEPLLGSIEQNAAALKGFVEAVCADAKTDKVILIGHSMGGVVIRSYLHGGGHARIEQAICIGSPHHGTVLANGLAPLGENLRQMSRGSSWIRQFNENEALPCPVPITAIVTPHDNIVAPQDSALLHYPNAHNVSLPGIGHLEMVISRPVFEAAVEALNPIPLLAEGKSP
jgi:predicted alpha/beta hydrolase family esterase